MSHRSLAAVALVALALPVLAADDALPAAVAEAVKKSVVVVKLEVDTLSAVGSGFVIGGDDKTLYVATSQYASDGVTRFGRPAMTTVVFDSGTKTERSFIATVAASDPQRDLAILRVTGVKTPPAPLALTAGVKLSEAMTVYPVGAQFNRTGTSEKPTYTLSAGKVSVSTLRKGLEGEFGSIQTDGFLTHSHNGGPVVDAKGKLVGVMLAGSREGLGTGHVVPADELRQMMRGRVGMVVVTPMKVKGDKTEVRLVVVLTDPADNVRSAAVKFLQVPAKAKRPDATAFAKSGDVLMTDLTMANGFAATELTLDSADGELLVEVSFDTADKKTVTERLRALPVGEALMAGGIQPPTGWGSHSTVEQSFRVWLPDKTTRKPNDNPTMTVNGKPVKGTSFGGELVKGLSFEAAMYSSRTAVGGMPKRGVAELFRDQLAETLKGKVTDTQDVYFGSQPGVEAVIQAGTDTTRVRLFANTAGVHMASVSGSQELAFGKEAGIFLASFRPSEGRPTFGGPQPGGVGGPGQKGDGPTVLGGWQADKTFSEVAPQGGLLVGLEVGLAPAFSRTMTRAVRPIFMSNNKISSGDQQGTQLSDVVTLKAKAGYAVGAVSVMYGGGFDGISVTFMKVVDGDKLDPKDSYESKYVGSNENKTLTKLGGDGTPVIGILGRKNDKDVTGFGILLKGQEPKKK